MNEEQTLELQMKATAQKASSEMDVLVKNLTNIENVLTNMYLELGTIEKQTNKVSNTSVKNINKVKKEADKLSPSLSKIGKTINNTLTFVGVKRLTKNFLDWMELATDRTEQLNLFNVVFKNIEVNGQQTFSKLGKEATKFQYKLNEAFGTNLTQTLKYQGLFQSMGENVGINDYYSSIMSETMTKLTYDLASLYNRSEDATAEAIRAGVYAGQTKPLRSFGIDVTQTSMQPILDELGINDRSIKQMSQAEKEILRYIATLRQAQIAMGDYANTIESPANQMKVFQNLLVESKAALTSLFIGTYQKILPYANAFLMVVKEVSKAIADMFGIELKDYNSGIATQSDLYSDLSDSIDDATDSAKELKRQTLGFDQINNINEDTSSGGSSIASGGIDQRLLDAIYGYDNGMDKVRMKASEIRDNIMEWLGFHKEIDPLTGETVFKLDEGKTRFKQIADVVKFIFDNGLTFMQVIAGYKIIKKLGEIYTNFKNIKNIIGEMNPAVQLLAAGIAGIGIADLASKTDVYKDFANGLTGGTWEEYGNPSIIEAWTKTIPGALSSLRESKQNNQIQSLENLKNATILLEGNRDKLNDSQIEVLESNIEEFKRQLVGNENPFIAGLTGGKIGDKSGLKQEIEDYYNDIVENIDLYSNITSFSSNGGIDMGVYTEALTNYFDTIKSGMPVIDEYVEKINQSEASYIASSSAVDDLLLKLSSGQFKITADDLDNLNTYLINMKTSSDTAGQATVDAITSISSSLLNQGYISDETAKKVVENAEKKRLAESGATQEMIEKIQGLRKQLEQGQITEDEYIQKTIELWQENSKTASSFDVSRQKLKSLSDQTIVSSKDVKSASTNLTTATNEYEKAKQDVIDTTQKSIDMMVKEQLKYDENSDEYKQYADAIDGLNRQQEDSINSLDDTFSTYLKNTLLSLITSEQYNTKEGRKLAENLNAELEKMGQGIDLSQNLSKITKQLSMDGTEVGSKIKLSSNVDTIVSNFVNKFQNGANWVSNLMNRLTANIPQNADGGAFYNGNWHNIKQYANGGAPTHGTMFVAGERGAEIVGNINGRTEVLNQSQLASVMYSAVANAMSQYGGGTSQIEVIAHTDEGVVIDRINQKTKQTGVCPINIPI